MVLSAGDRERSGLIEQLRARLGPGPVEFVDHRHVVVARRRWGRRVGVDAERDGRLGARLVRYDDLRGAGARLGGFCEETDPACLARRERRTCAGVARDREVCRFSSREADRCDLGSGFTGGDGDRDLDAGCANGCPRPFDRGGLNELRRRRRGLADADLSEQRASSGAAAVLLVERPEAFDAPRGTQVDVFDDEPADRLPASTTVPRDADPGQVLGLRRAFGFGVFPDFQLPARWRCKFEEEVLAFRFGLDVDGAFFAGDRYRFRLVEQPVRSRRRCTLRVR